MNDSLQNQLRCREISLEEALSQFQSTADNWSVAWVDSALCKQFLRKTRNTPGLPPIIPLILWQNCYYLGAISPLSAEQRLSLGDCLGADIKVLPIRQITIANGFATTIPSTIATVPKPNVTR
jgi:hypothetical protein